MQAEPAPPRVEPPALVTRRDLPCPGCLARIPLRREGAPRPLVVVLHGDRGEPDKLLRLLRPEADRRGFALLVLSCPASLGCTTRSFWQWAGAPGWLWQQVEALGQAALVDRTRVFLLGWSGGASYLTDFAGQLPPGFAALGLVGGGMPSRQPAACAPCPPPVYFAVGERNPLRALAVDAREALRRCGHALTWVDLPRADHEGEWAALEHGQVSQLLDFFAAHPSRCPPKSPGG